MAYGDIGTAKSAVTVKEGTCQTPFVIRVGVGVFACFYRDDTAGLIVKTYRSDIAGAITGISTADTVVDALGGTQVQVLHISGTIYVALYVGESGQPYVTTLSIGTNGVILDANITRFSCASISVNKPHMCYVRGTIYCIVYDHDSPAAGEIRTISISLDGVTISALGWWPFYVGRTYFSCPFRIADGFVCIPFTPTIGYCHIFSVEISAGGIVTEARITDWECDPMTGAPWVIKVGPNQWAISCRGTDNDGYVLSVSILDNGEITPTWDDQLEFETDTSQTNMIISLGGIYYGVCFIGYTNHWGLATFSITTDGTISNTNIDSFDSGLPTAAYGRWCWVCHDIYVIPWEDVNNDIKLTAIDIESYGVSIYPKHEMMMDIGP